MNIAIEAIELSPKLFGVMLNKIINIANYIAKKPSTDIAIKISRKINSR